MNARTEAASRAYTDEQFLICSLARQLRDGETIAVGNLSMIPAAAALLAQATHAPRSTVYMLGQPGWPFDGTKEFFDFMQRGGVDVFFLSGGQIDRYGGINLQAIGDYRRPKARLPGGAGSAVVAFVCKRVLLFKTDHTVKGFPERLDMTTSTFAQAEDVWRRGRLDGVFTPLGTLRPTPPDGALRLTETAPDWAPEQVQARTGFDVRAGADGIARAGPPTPAELEALRSAVFERLLPVYPVFARSALG
ncbi:CoA-transferase [Paenibacillus sp. HJGM_3]|uniref:CoA-transferase n=1 Tax=Paenibacillus sp. HJGM_3 TaxID=3379816 RepID=UPI00385EA6F4